MTEAAAAGSVTPAQFAKWTQDATDANRAVQRARLMMGTGRKTLDGKEVDDYLMDAQQITERLRYTTQEAGKASLAAVPEPIAAPKGEGLDLAALAFFADPDAPELLALLDQAQAVAERIDARRGRTVGADIPLSPGESRGTDLAETISEIALRVRGEVHGPVGRD